jgi:methyl-accepting chemotaxis protein WspA
MVRFGEGLRESSAERSRRAGDLALWNLRVGLSTLPILLMGWLLAARMLGRWRAMLKTSHEQLSERTEKLSNLVRRVQSTAQGVAASSAQLLATQRSLDAMARRQSESTHSIAASTTQIAASSQQLMRTIEGVDVASSEAATAALASRRAISDVGRTMDQMVEGAGSIAGQLESIREESGKITALISAITAVADQTNLLSLNAAIEAEKAGQLGRGFSVVAREMRTLADRTAISILQIEGTVGEVRNAVAADLFSAEIRRDAEHVRLAWEQLASIITRVESIARQIGLVRSFATEQATGATNIRDAMHQLGEAARITAQSLNESRLVVENLNSEIQIRSYAIEAGRRYRGRSI